MASLGIRHCCAPAEVLQASQGDFHQKSTQRAKTAILTASTWNIRSMVDTAGLVEVSSQTSNNQRGQTRKVDQIVFELTRYGVSVGALQETKWFGDAVYEMNGNVLLSAGQPTPADGVPIQRGGGVALVLLGSALVAWRCGGKQWKVWSSRCISAFLEFSGHAGRLHVLSCYVPTRAASREDKDKFLNRHDVFITSVPARDCYVILGDFNARIVSRSDDEDDLWSSVLGPHGYGEVNDAGKELFSFLSCHQAAVCNTWFEKKDVYKQTWQHLRSKKWNCSDFVVMNQRHRRYCVDVSVKRGAFCNTDHNFVCTRLRFVRKCYHGMSEFEKRSPRVKHYDVGKLNCQDSTAVHYLKAVLDQFYNSWLDDGTLKEKWQVLQDTLTSAAEDLLGIVNNQIGSPIHLDTYSHCLPFVMKPTLSRWVQVSPRTSLSLGNLEGRQGGQ